MATVRPARDEELYLLRRVGRSRAASGDLCYRLVAHAPEVLQSPDQTLVFTGGTTDGATQPAERRVSPKSVGVPRLFAMMRVVHRDSGGTSPKTTQRRRWRSTRFRDL